jgi:hypothetical protein
MGGRPAVELSVDQAALRRVALELRSMADGKALGAALRKELRAAAAPAVVDLRAAVLAAPGRASATPALRTAVAAKIGVAVRTVGRDPSVAIRARKTPGARGFRSAAKALNAPSFRHPVFGRTVWVVQVGAPRWWDATVEAHRWAFHAAAVKAIEHWAAEAAARMRSS